MLESAVILAEYEEINSLLYKPIIATQRIKYTCIDVSANQIVLGSTSGSLYLFKREPCVFQQLIPLSEGTVTRVLISPDEKSLALSTKRGSVCAVNVKPSVKLLTVSNEHLGENVTSLCWSTKSSEIYVGDSNGKISTVVLSIFTVNAMFQPPSCSLMHLDSSIVQVDYSSHYLLVSTQTRCYICDTVQEQFKQIGNKARDGDFGACFLQNPVDPEKQSLTNLNEEKIGNRPGGLSSIIGSNDESIKEENLKIFSARPGCRLWEVTVDGTVIKTHQFKDAFALPPTKIYQSSNVKTLNMSQQNEQTCASRILNFSRLFVINEKYLLSYTNNGLYVIDPANAVVILWTDELKNIASAQTIDDKIYVMKTTGTFHCLALNSVENLILKLFEAKLYSDCLNACMIFRSDLMKLVESNLDTSDEILDTVGTESNDITSILEPAITVIQSNLKNPPKRLNSGIVVVNSGNTKLRGENRMSIPPAKYNTDHDDHLENGKTVSDDSEQIVCNIVKKLPSKKNGRDEVNNLSETMSQLDMLENNVSEEKIPNGRSNEMALATAEIQTELQPIHEIISTLKISMTEYEIEGIIRKVAEILRNINIKYGSMSKLQKFLYEVIRSLERHYFHALLENISSEIIEETKNLHVLDEIEKAFLDLNASQSNYCSCGFPKLVEQITEPKFLHIGRTLLKRYSTESTEKCIKLCRNVPYMWRDYLPIRVSENCRLDDIIHLCLHTRDYVVISIILPLMNSKQWEIAIQCIEQMEIGRCSLCKNINDKNSQNEVIDWSRVISEIMKKQGAESAMTFLALLESHLPKIKLKESIFQSFIFTKLLSRHGFDQVVEFDRDNLSNNEYSSICSAKARKELVDALEKDLERPVDQNIFGSGAHHWGMRLQSKSSTCPCCTLSLQTPVLLGKNGISIFPCGHAYHVNCLIQKKLTNCYLHSDT